jgi:hypothetical protein
MTSRFFFNHKGHEVLRSFSLCVTYATSWFYFFLTTKDTKFHEVFLLCVTSATSWLNSYHEVEFVLIFMIISNLSSVGHFLVKI